jgi:hypothetical protein
MASAFWGGVASSLGNTIDTSIEEKRRLKQREADREADKKDWEWKAKKTNEIEQEVAKTRVVSTEVFDAGNGQYMIQGLNAAGEAVGEPRPAPPSRVEAYKQGEKIRDAAYRKDVAAAERSEAETANIPREQARADKLANASIMSAMASAENAKASAGYTRLQGIEQGLRNEAITKDPTLLNTSRRGGKGGGAGEGGGSVAGSNSIRDYIDQKENEFPGLGRQLVNVAKSLEAQGKTEDEIIRELGVRTQMYIHNTSQPERGDSKSAILDRLRSNSRTE